MDDDGPYEYLVLTDRDSIGDSDLYPHRGPAVGADCASIPLDVAAAHASHRLVAVSGPVSDDDRVLWTGRLEVPSGVLLVSDRSMARRAELAVDPGRYRITAVVRSADAATSLLVSVVPEE